MVKRRKPLLKGLASLANSSSLKKIVKENSRRKKKYKVMVTQISATIRRVS